MTPTELQQRYPAVYDAVLWAEQLVEWEPLMTAGWAEFPAELLAHVQQVIREHAAIGAAKLAEIQRQMDNPAFVQYLAERAASWTST